MQLQWNRPLIIPQGVIQTPFSLIPSNHINREHRTRLTPDSSLYSVFISQHYLHPDVLASDWSPHVIPTLWLADDSCLLHCITSIMPSPLSSRSHSGPSLGSRKSRVLLVSSRLTFDLMSQCFNLSSVIIGLMRDMWITDGARHELTVPRPGLFPVSRMWMNWWG